LPEENNEESLQTESNSTQTSVWKQGAIASAVISVLYTIGVLINRPPFLASLLYALTLGLAVTFFVFWLISAGFIWLWRILGFVLIGILLAIGLLGYAVYRSSNQKQENPSVAPPISTAQPVAIATSTPQLPVGLKLETDESKTIELLNSGKAENLDNLINDPTSRRCISQAQ
jgi:energy-coupling factor transporter transmembrane protein EcfT